MTSDLVFRGEQSLASGTGVQAAFGSRWGDYSSISVDPTDDCTFWITNEYYTAESAKENPFGWLTRIGRFKFDECSSAPRSVIAGRVFNAANPTQPLAGATVTANAVYTRAAGATGIFNMTVVPNTYVLTATARGFRSQSVNVTVTNGQTLIHDFALEPIAVFEYPTINITAESCAVNNSIDPSETVTLNVVLANTGAAIANNLTVTLLPVGGVINPSAAQNYGAISNNGGFAARSFTFTASPDLRCGEPINLTFQLQDGAENLGTVTQKSADRQTAHRFERNIRHDGRTESAAGLDDFGERRTGRLENFDDSASNAAARRIFGCRFAGRRE